MKKSFLDWLHEHAAHAGLPGLLEGALAIMAFAGALSAILGIAAIRAGAMFAIIFGVLGLIATLLFSRLEKASKSELYNDLLARYCRILSDQFEHSWKMTHWKDELSVRSNGDTTEIITVRAIVNCDRMDFFKIYTGPGWNYAKRLRAEVKIKVRSLTAGNTGGTRREVTHSWTESGNFEIITHFKEPLARGCEINLHVELEWPSRCLPLMRRHTPEDFALTFTSPIDYLEYRISLPSGFDVYYDTIGLTEKLDNFKSSYDARPDGGIEVTLIARDLHQNHRVGLRLDLK
jgi:hypothetical protein